MEKVSRHEFTEELGILKVHGIGIGKEEHCIFRTISVESNPVVYNVVQVNSAGVNGRYDEILESAEGDVLVVGAGNMSFAGKLASKEKVRTIRLIEEEEDIFDSIINLPMSPRINIQRIGYDDFKGSERFDFIFIDACKCLDTPKGVMKGLADKFMQFLRKEGKLAVWFDGV